jgi:hypothetical protein
MDKIEILEINNFLTFDKNYRNVIAAEHEGLYLMPYLQRDQVHRLAAVPVVNNNDDSAVIKKRGGGGKKLIQNKCCSSS